MFTGKVSDVLEEYSASFFRTDQSSFNLEMFALRTFIRSVTVYWSTQ